MHLARPPTSSAPRRSTRCATRYGAVVVGETLDGTPALDLRAGVRAALAESGVTVGARDRAASVHGARSRLLLLAGPWATRAVRPPVVWLASPDETLSLASVRGASLIRPGRSPIEIAARSVALRRRIAERTDRDVRIVCVTKGHPDRCRSGRASRPASTTWARTTRRTSSARRTGGTEPPTAGGTSSVGCSRTRCGRWLRSCHLWQSVDRESVATEIARRAPGASVLVQLDLAGLADRGGCPPDDAPALVRRCTELGLDVERPDGRRRARTTRGLAGRASDCSAGSPMTSAFAIRSMGMSGDLEVAVEEGSTMVRIGSHTRRTSGPTRPRLEHAAPQHAVMTCTTTLVRQGALDVELDEERSVLARSGERSLLRGRVRRPRLRRRGRGRRLRPTGRRSPAGARPVRPSASRSTVGRPPARRATGRRTTVVFA